MPVPIPINPSTPYAMPSPPKPFRQSPNPGVLGNGTKQRRNAVPQKSLLASATVATHHPDITSARLKSDLHEQKPRTKRRRNAVPKQLLEASAETATREPKVSEIPSSDSLRDGPWRTSKCSATKFVRHFGQKVCQPETRCLKLQYRYKLPSHEESKLLQFD